MEIVIKVLIGLIAALHLYFLYFEMFAWDTLGKNIFRSLPKDMFSKTKVMAANQGLYNGFLSAGLIWTFFIKHAEWYFNISIFFLTCVSVAGIYGALSVDKKIFFVQALPALIALLLLILF